MRCGEAQRRKGRRRHAGGEARGVENVGSARLVGDGAPWRGHEGDGMRVAEFLRVEIARGIRTPEM